MTSTPTRGASFALVLVPASSFAAAVSTARASDPRIAENVTEYSAEQYMRRGAACYLSDDGRSGFAIARDGELVSVFSLERGRGRTLVQHAVRRGAAWLDCFDGYLSALYANFGFVTVGRTPNHATGGPDVVVMHLHSYRSAPYGWTCRADDHCPCA